MDFGTFLSLESYDTTGWRTVCGVVDEDHRWTHESSCIYVTSSLQKFGIRKLEFVVPYYVEIRMMFLQCFCCSNAYNRDLCRSLMALQPNFVK